MHFLDKVLDLFFPRHCLQCQRTLPSHEGGYLCHECFKDLIFTGDHTCPRCGRSTTDAPSAICQNCLDLNPFFKEGISLFAFNRLGREFIHTLKYKNGTYLTEDLRKIFKHKAQKLGTLNQAVFVPVPIHFIRKWRRGYNQSALIAKLLKSFCEGTYMDILSRKRNTCSQTSLTRNERKANVKDAFVLKVNNLDASKTYVLVDDVFTTGATLNECASVLYKNGARDIRVFTLAHS